MHKQNREEKLLKRSIFPSNIPQYMTWLYSNLWWPSCLWMLIWRTTLLSFVSGSCYSNSESWFNPWGSYRVLPLWRVIVGTSSTKSRGSRCYLHSSAQRCLTGTVEGTDLDGLAEKGSEWWPHKEEFHVSSLPMSANQQTDKSRC